MKATTTGDKTAIKHLQVEVCGLETLDLVSSDTNYKILAPLSGFEVISTTTSAGWFTLTKSITTSLCEIKSYGLYSDIECNNQLNNEAIVQDTSGSAVGNNYPIKINKTASFTAQNVFLKAETTGGKTAIKKLVIEVCGAETISLKAPATTYKQTNGKADSKKQLMSAFINAWYTMTKTSSSSFCDVNAWGLYTDSGLSTAWTTVSKVELTITSSGPT
jgi:hypothetical protein